MHINNDIGHGRIEHEYICITRMSCMYSCIPTYCTLICTVCISIVTIVSEQDAVESSLSTEIRFLSRRTFVWNWFMLEYVLIMSILKAVGRLKNDRHINTKSEHRRKWLIALLVLLKSYYTIVNTIATRIIISYDLLSRFATPNVRIEEAIPHVTERIAMLNTGIRTALILQTYSWCWKEMERHGMDKPEEVPQGKEVYIRSTEFY